MWYTAFKQWDLFDYEDLEIVRRGYPRCQFGEHCGAMLGGVFRGIRTISIQNRAIKPQIRQKSKKKIVVRHRILHKANIWTNSVKYRILPGSISHV